MLIGRSSAIMVNERERTSKTHTHLAVVRIFAGRVERFRRCQLGPRSKTSRTWPGVMATSTLARIVYGVGEINRCGRCFCTFSFLGTFHPWRRLSTRSDGILHNEELKRKGRKTTPRKSENVKVFGCRPHGDGAPHSGGPAYENLQGRKPRVGWMRRGRERAASAMGI
jgi:hypothetical protein